MSFQSALFFTLKHEGGYSCDPRDPGGATCQGITQRTYDAWRKSSGLPAADVKNIDHVTVETIYKMGYWFAAHCDQMPDKLAAIVFDTAVNTGVSYAMRMLQTCLGLAPDGAYGPKTAAGIAAADVDTLTFKYLEARKDHYEDIVERNPGQSVYLRGWLNRVNYLAQEIA